MNVPVPLPADGEPLDEAVALRVWLDLKKKKKTTKKGSKEIEEENVREKGREKIIIAV